MEIDASAIAALGDRLRDIADYLEVRAHYTRDGIADDYGFIDVSAAGSFADVLGDYELERIALCDRLRHLDDLAADAGACYLDTEEIVSRGAAPVRVDGRPAGLR